MHGLQSGPVPCGSTAFRRNWLRLAAFPCLPNQAYAARQGPRAFGKELSRAFAYALDQFFAPVGNQLTRGVRRSNLVEGAIGFCEQRFKFVEIVKIAKQLAQFAKFVTPGADHLGPNRLEDFQMMEMVDDGLACFVQRVHLSGVDALLDEFAAATVTLTQPRQVEPGIALRQHPRADKCPDCLDLSFCDGETCCVIFLCMRGVAARGLFEFCDDGCGSFSMFGQFGDRFSHRFSVALERELVRRGL